MTSTPTHHEPQQSLTKEDPDMALAIVSLAILVMLPLPPVSLILAIIAKKKSAKLGYKNTLAVASIWVNSILTGLLIIGGILLLVLADFS